MKFKKGDIVKYIGPGLKLHKPVELVVMYVVDINYDVMCYDVYKEVPEIVGYFHEFEHVGISTMFAVWLKKNYAF